MENFEILIVKTVEFVKNRLQNAEGGHDWWHTHRVWKTAQLIARTETANKEVVELAALLHDIADAKFHNGDETLGARIAQQFLESHYFNATKTLHIANIIQNMSFKGGNVSAKFNSLEMQIVQDADRLDALGAVGIARAFNYGGFKNRPMYDPNIAPQMNMSPDEYRNSTAPTINHFYEKLLLLKDRMNTETGKKLAQQRHRFMENYLKQFYAEWNGLDNEGIIE